MSTCINIVCKLVDSAADSKLKTLKTGETFGVEKPGGEARIYIGQENNEKDLDDFFGFNEVIDVQTFKVSKSDLLDYLLNAKNEFEHPKATYRLNISELYEGFISMLISIENDVFEVQFKKNINGRRYYLSPFKEGGRRYSEYIRRICLPLCTNYNFIKSIGDDGQVVYYFKPVFITISDNTSNELDMSNSTYFKETTNIIRAMRTKPFLLLAGISGTGKSRIVKQMAFDSCPDNAVLRADLTSPGNYCLIEVKPNWHDSTELLGYESQIGKPHYQLTSFVKFLAKAMLYPDVPFFVCLDEMNLAPVEQYFAEFLSVLESRTKLENGHIVSEPLIEADIFRKYALEKSLFSLKEETSAYSDISSTVEPATPYGKEAEVYEQLKKHGLHIPENVIVIGTVNMDETTHQFSRKVIDRAMTIEMNLPEGENPDGTPINPFMDFFANGSELAYRTSPTSPSLYFATETKAKDVIAKLVAVHTGNTEWLKGEVAASLTHLNDALNNTPFKVAYRVQNELLLYFFEQWRDEKKPTEVEKWQAILNNAIDQILMMKVLPRVEGDNELLEKPIELLINYCDGKYPNASKKLGEMKERLKMSQFTSFWP